MAGPLPGTGEIGGSASALPATTELQLCIQVARRRWSAALRMCDKLWDLSRNGLLACIVGFCRSGNGDWWRALAAADGPRQTLNQ